MKKVKLILIAALLAFAMTGLQLGANCSASATSCSVRWI